MSKNQELEELKKAYQELCKSHNTLCLAHDALFEQFQEVSVLVDQLMDAVFQPVTEFDS